MMKICHMTSAHTSYDTRIFYKECTSLANAGYEVFLVCEGKDRIENGVHVIGAGELPQSRKERMLSFSKKIYNIALGLDCDVYHFHDPELLPYGLKLAKKGKKVIFDSHENYVAQIQEKQYLPKVIRFLISRGYKLYESYVLKSIDAVVVPCTFDGINIFNNRAKETVFIANYPVLTSFYDIYNHNTEKMYDICYVGSLTYDRGIYHLVKSSNEGNFSILLAGNYPEISFQEKIERMPGYNNVTYLGYVSNSEIARIIQTCRIGAQLILDKGQYYHVDTLGIKVFEYMSMGIPVIMSDTPYSKGLVDKYKFGICVDPESCEEIINAVNYLVEHTIEAQEMGRNGRDAISRVFNWKTQEPKLIELYERLITQKE